MPGTIEIIIVSLAAIIAAKLVFFGGLHRLSAVLPVGIGVVVIGGLAFGALFGSFSGDRTVGSRRSVSNPVVAPLTIDQLAGVGASVERAHSQISAESEMGTGAALSSKTSGLRIEQTDHGNLLVLALSDSIPEACLGPDGTAVLERLSSTIPPELRQAYALVSIPGAVGDAVPRLHALATAIARLSQTATVDSETPATDITSPETTETPPAEAPFESRPKWLTNPNEGQIVVQSQFEENDDLLQSGLAAEMTHRLLADALQLIGRDPSASLPLLKHVSMGPGAVKMSIEEQFNDEARFETASGLKRMFRMSALVRFPEEIQRQAMTHVRRSVQNQRTWTVGATAVSLGLAVILAAGLLQLTRTSSRLIRWSGIPLITVLMLFSLAVSSRLIDHVVSNESTEVPIPFELPTTVIDVDPDSGNSTD